MLNDDYKRHGLQVHYVVNQWTLSTVYEQPTRQWPASLSALTGVNHQWLSLPWFALSGLRAIRLFLYQSPICDCWLDTHGRRNKRRTHGYEMRGDNSSPVGEHMGILCNWNALQQLCVLRENQGGEKIQLGCNCLLGIPTVPHTLELVAPVLCNANVASHRP